MRSMLAVAGYPVPSPTGSPFADRAALLAPMMSLLEAQGIDPMTATGAEACAAIVKASSGGPGGDDEIATVGDPSWWEQQSEGTKTAIKIGGGAAVGGTLYLLFR